MIESWVGRPENTARSVLVTIFGDTVLPASNDIWLSQLFQLTEPFGFSGRLVRTSIFRLAAEGWLTNERVGRESRYSLTNLAIDESLRAAKRIYDSPNPDWSGEWTVVFLAVAELESAQRANLVKHLHWHGFISLARDVLAVPISDAASTRNLVQLIEPDLHLPIGVLRFSELEELVDQGFFDAHLSVDTMAGLYDDFIGYYRQLREQVDTCTASEAFVVRTMLIHDFRRMRLRGPDLPAALLPKDWSGDTAITLAAQLYAELSTAASPWLSEVLGVDYPPQFSNRFAAIRADGQR